MSNLTYPDVYHQRCHAVVCTCLLPVWRGAAASVQEVVDLACSAAGFGAAGEVGKRKPLVVFQGGVTKVFSAEEKERVEQHDGRIGAQLLTLPQVRFSDARCDHTTCRREEQALSAFVFVFFC